MTELLTNVDFQFTALVVLAVIGYVVLKLQRNRHQNRLERENNKRRLERTDTSCHGCTHNLSYHNPVTHECSAQMKRPSKWDSNGYPQRYEYVLCSCQQYVGDLPADLLLNSFTVPLSPAPDPVQKPAAED